MSNKIISIKNKLHKLDAPIIYHGATISLRDSLDITIRGHDVLSLHGIGESDTYNKKINKMLL